MKLGTIITSSADEFTYVVSSEAAQANAKVYGALLVTESRGQILLSQSVSITMESLASNDKVFQQVIAEKGRGFEGFSRSNDLYIGTADILSVASSDDMQPCRLSLPPAGESSVYLMKDCPFLPSNGPLGKLQPFCALPTNDPHYGVLGTDIQDKEARVSFILKDSRPETVEFRGKRVPGGHGEGKFVFVGGRSGSRKTIEAMKLIALTLARNPEMGFISIDPKGELFAEDKFILDPGVKEMRHYELMSAPEAKPAEPVYLKDIRLTDPELLLQQLHRYCVFGLGMTDNGEDSKAKQTANAMLDWFMTRQKGQKGGSEYIDLTKMVEATFRGSDFERAVRSGYQRSDSADTAWRKASNNYDSRVAQQIRREIITMFTGDETDLELLRDVAKDGRRVFLKFNPKEDVTVTKATVGSLMKTIRDELLSDYYNQQDAGTVANFILAMEEAHTFLPSNDLIGDDSQIRAIKRTTIDAVTKLRAMGAHFFFITQSVANFEGKVVEQCSTKLFGKGLESGNPADRALLERVLGKKGFRQYASASRACGLDDAIFAVSGDLCNLRIGGDGCVVYRPIEGNITDELRRLNPHIYGGADE